MMLKCQGLCVIYWTIKYRTKRKENKKSLLKIEINIKKLPQ